MDLLERFDSETPMSIVERNEVKKLIRHAIDKLPARLYETFILHFYQELTPKEIAQKMGISLANVYKRISQARKKLRVVLTTYLLSEEAEKK